jgi:serine/threonine protein kinase
MELTTGLLFADRYKLIKRLGRGGFAEVWLADDNLTGVQVAVKVYAPGTGLDENGIKIFTQEFSVVFDMNHTNLLRPTHYDCYERMPYLIMPYIKNGSAFQYIVDGQAIPEEECWKLLHDVAAGLAYLHEKQPPLIHQDIKPDNIMIGDEGQYLITDFGISARVRSTIRGAKAQEQSGGTLAYMGPERFGPTPKPIMASDVWSMGAMMYELITGTPPFGNHGGMLQKNGADIPIIEEDYSQELKDIIYACLAKETWDRPSAKKIEEKTYNKLHGIVTPDETPKETPEEKPIEQPIVEQSIVEKPVIEKPIAEKPVIEKPVVKEASAKASKSQPITSKKGINKNIIIGAVAALVVLIGIIAMCSGGGESEEAVPVAPEEIAPVINYDSLAQVSIQEGSALLEQADTFMTNHEEDKFDSKYNKVEETYISALKKFEEALANKDSLSAEISSNAIIQKSAAAGKLLNIYKELSEIASNLKEAGLADGAAESEARAEAIKPYIPDLINNENQHDDEQNP